MIYTSLKLMLLVLGLIKLISIVVYIFGLLNRFCLFHKDYSGAVKYGKGTLAVVTGASDGIGTEYARRLAK